MIKKALAIISVFALIISFAACKKNDDLKKSNMVYDGNEVYSDKDGYYYKDADGNRVEVNKDDVVFTEYNSANSESTTLSPDAAKDFLDMMASPDKYTEDIPAPELEGGNELIPEDSFTDVEVDLDSEGKPDHGEEAKSYQEIIKSGTFTIEFVMCTIQDGVTTTIPFTIIKEGNKVAAEVIAPMEGAGSMRMKYLVKDGIQYAILPAAKSYFELGPADDVDTIFSEEMLDEIANTNAEGMTYVSSAEVTIDGKKYICDIYDLEDGSKSKLYYLDGNLARQEIITADGDSNIVEYKNISGKVDSAALQLPKGYIDVTPYIDSDMLG